MRESQRGFTLIEVLAAASLLAVVIVSVTSLFVVSMKTNVASGDYTQCATLAEERMETLKNIDYEALNSGGSIATPVDGFSKYVDVDSNGSNDFVVAWSVAAAGDLSGSLSASDVLARQIDVRCTALRGNNNQVGKPKVVTLSTYRAKEISR